MNLSIVFIHVTPSELKGSFKIPFECVRANIKLSLNIEN